MDPRNDKDTLNKLREARKPWIDRAKDSIKTQTALIKVICAQLESGPKTVSQIAAAAG